MLVLIFCFCFRGFKVSQIRGYVACFLKDIGSILPNFHFVISGRYWSDRQEFQEQLRLIFMIVRCLPRFLRCALGESRGGPGNSKKNRRCVAISFDNYCVFMVHDRLNKMANQCLEMDSNIIFDIFRNLQMLTECWTSDPYLLQKYLREIHTLCSSTYCTCT